MSHLPEWPADCCGGTMTLENEISQSEQRTEKLATLARIEMWCARRGAEALYDWRDNPKLSLRERRARMMDWHDWEFAWRIVRALIDGRQLIVPYSNSTSKTGETNGKPNV